VSRRLAYPALAAICLLPRLAILFHERGTITAAFTEKSDTFASVYVQSGTFGFLPGVPSAYTQPLYGWFLIPVYWLFGRNWLSIGLSQAALAVVTAWLVFEIGRRLSGPRWGAVAAAIATLNPYLAWHDMHVNREIVDQVLAAAVVLLTLAAAERPSKRLGAALGLVTGLAILGNTRLVGIPILCAAFLLWRLPRTRATVIVAGLVLAGAGVAVAPWLVRNKVSIGCWALTTDGRALWKANNPQTYGLLSSGQWIDNVAKNSPRPPAPNRITPEEARGYLDKGRPDVAYARYPNECVEMSFYEHQAITWVRDHPGAKAKLALLSLKLLWQPSVIETGNPGTGTQLDVGRRIVEPVYMWLVYAFAAAGIFLVSRRFLVLALLLLAYQSACAAAFVGATRYRIAWDFLLVLLATTALAHGWDRVRARRAAREAIEAS
jgi:4-amino-4-deoxy-L-arabinose transferase-like glycosyltransferase